MSTDHSSTQCPLLKHAAFYFPIIDNHTHNLLKAEHRSDFPFEGLTSEANGEALIDATNTIALYRATIQLAKLYGCEPTFDAVKKARDSLSYEELCQKCMKPTGIASLLLDDGIDAIQNLCYDYRWHDRFTSTPSKRIVRVETLAQDLIKTLHSQGKTGFHIFEKEFERLIQESCSDGEVAGFKSVACYRTGLDIQKPVTSDVEDQYAIAFSSLKNDPKLRLASKALNDFIVRLVLRVAGEHGKPVQFHTGLGDNDISLVTANPAVMQPIFKEFPQTVIVLLHSSYPFCQEAGYLATVYKNVYLDFGEVFPMISRDGQLSLTRQMFELTPTTKLIWSTDGHWWPETYYLGVIQVREALYEVLASFVAKGDMTEAQAVTTVERVFFHNSNDIYHLGLTPRPTQQISPSLQASLTTQSAETLKSLAASGVRFLRIYWVDYASVPRYRVVPIGRLQRMMEKDGRAGYAIVKSSFAFIGDHFAAGFGAVGVYYHTIDMKSVRRLSYAKGHAFVMGSLQEMQQVNGSYVGADICPRTTLARIIEDAKAKDAVNFLIGFEIEFVLLNPKDLTPVNDDGWCHSSAIPGGSDIAKVLDEIADELEVAGIELQHYHAEAARGQYEVVTGPLPPLEAVDALIATRQIISNVAQKYGMRMTLTPKPTAYQCGTGAHMNLSISSDKLENGGGPAANGPINKFEGSFLQSILDHMPALCAFALPSPASYWRLVDGTWSGGTWVCWGRDNKDCPIRLAGDPTSGWRFEYKPLDGTSNPYLMTAATLYAGILGIRNNQKLVAGDVQGIAAAMSDKERQALGVSSRLARNIDEALDYLKNDKELIDGLGANLVKGYISTMELRRDMVAKMTDEQHWAWMARNY
ncbi:hypothetical protein BU17DRAFT_83867 [Hysterangium stoloniferum]|nr:hypothetical protein BU17DRAFT_83867 [Hysterangium stoloniferum]